MAADGRIERLFRQHAQGIVTGPELVNNVYDVLAHDGQFDLVRSTTLPLLERDETAVRKWVRWIEDKCCEGSNWAPFLFAPGPTPEEYSKQMRSNFKQVARIVQAVLGERQTAVTARMDQELENK